VARLPELEAKSREAATLSLVEKTLSTEMIQEGWSLDRLGIESRGLPGRGWYFAADLNRTDGSCHFPRDARARCAMHSAALQDPFCWVGEKGEGAPILDTSLEPDAAVDSTSRVN